MPRDAFNKLKPKKKKQIFQAAKLAFTINSYEDVSISQIIKEVGISRGSFYLYFENKLDLYFYVLSYNRDELSQIFINDINKRKSVFEIFTDLFEELIKYLSQEDPQFIERTILNLNPKIILYFTSGFKNTNGTEIDYSLIGDYDKLRINDKKDYIAILEMMTSLIIMEYSFVLLNRYTVDTARSNLLKKFDFIKKSVYK